MCGLLSKLVMFMFCLALFEYMLPDTVEAALLCSDCHGTRSTFDNRPEDASFRNPSSGGFQGNHRTHMAEGANSSTCSKCHPGSENYSSRHSRDSKNRIKVSSNINYSPHPSKATYKNNTSAFPQTQTPSLGTCNNVNCHFEKTTPTWGDPKLTQSTSNCNACHNAPPTDNKHTKHFAAISSAGGRTLGNVCIKCHIDHVSEPDIFAHATSAGKRALAVRFKVFPNTTGHYSGDVSYPHYLPSQNPPLNGTCDNLYCHSNGAPLGKPNIFRTPTWNGAALTCASCHESAGLTTGLSGRHGVHTSGDYAFTCERCHSLTASGSATVTNKSLHVNKTKDMSFKEGGAYDNGTKGCDTTWCHTGASVGPLLTPVKWTDTTNTMKCYSCHRGITGDSTEANCLAQGGAWTNTPGQEKCYPFLNMSTNGHSKLVGSHWIRKYPCSYCHYATTDASGVIKDFSKHVNGAKDIMIDPQWNIVGRPAASYNPANKVCSNLYCHSDGTTNPEDIRDFPWSANKAPCNACHGHPTGSCSNAGCHDGRIDPVSGKHWVLPAKFGNVTAYKWPAGEEWLGSLPMFPSTGAGTARANSHQRHGQTEFSCVECHAVTVANGDCKTCHNTTKPPGFMGEASHLNGAYHVNKNKDVVFKDGGSYNAIAKTCSNTKCHTSATPPVWGGTVNSAITCLGCHGTTGTDIDTYKAFSGSTQARINLTQWVTTGHGRYSTSGRYPSSGNPAANFPGNPCWYCHDNSVLHKDETNPFRLRMHRQYERRFEKECVYCHMKKDDIECRSCHDTVESLAPQLTNITSVRYVYNHSPYASPSSQSCIATCHTNDATIHKTGSEKFWNDAEKSDVKNQYMMMGVCLQCHDDDSGGQCTSCHTAPESNPLKYSIGFNPNMDGSRFIKPKNARASAGHFGYKHYRAYVNDGTWKGGKFCWDCHDPHGDANIYMIHDKVATTTEGTYGVPKTRAPVSFTRKQSGLDYARTSSPYNGICNVCHSSSSKHFTSVSGDGHNVSRVCTTCHEHRFADSHANKQSCSTAGCHENKKPVPKHTAFGLPRDCTKCHAGTIGLRMDVMSQLRSNSHHIQRTSGEIKNTDCYECHWESRSNGLIDIQYHEGYNYLNYSTAKNYKVDLVIYGAGSRPTVYKNNSSAVQFLAKNIGTGSERSEVSKVSTHCLSCHSDKNNTTEPFGDCKTPRQYAWDRSSVAARYSQTGTTTWGKYPGTTNAAKKNITKSLSAHGNATANQGGWSTVDGTDGAIFNTRGGANAVQCFDCHSSHGSKVVGVTTNYTTFNGTRNGGNLKETQAGKGGYAMTYKASSNTDTNSVNPYNAGAGQCFDCHLTRNSGTTPWGFFSTFGAISSVMGYRDTSRFAKVPTAVGKRTAYKTPQIKGGHLKASSTLDNAAMGTIDGLCTPCHDPHGVTLSLGADQAYAVPLLKGTWMTSPYKEDLAIDGATTGQRGGSGCSGKNNPTPTPYVYTDQKTFGGTVTETDTKFAGLCVTCHTKADLTAGADKAKAWKSRDRIHQSVKGWGVNDMHSFTCSKCHQPHVSALPRLMGTNCLNVSHRGRVASGGVAGMYPNISNYGSFPKGKNYNNQNCHPDGAWPNNLWNTKTPW